MQDTNDQDFLSMAFADSGESEEEDGKRVDITKTSKAKEQFKLSKALAVMGVKASTFHALYVGGKRDKVQALLEKALMARVKDYRERTVEDLEDEFNPHFQVSDLQTIHEAYQYILRKYVQKERKEANFLSMEQIRANHERRKSRSNSRRNSNVDDIEMKDNDKNGGDNKEQSSKDKKKKSREKKIVKGDEHLQDALAQDVVNVMNSLLEPSPAMKRRGSIRRRSSASNYGDDDDQDLLSAALSASRRGSSRRSSISNYGDTDEPDLLRANISSRRGSRRKSILTDDYEPDTSLLSTATQSSRRGSRRKSLIPDDDEDPEPALLSSLSHNRRGSRRKSLVETDGIGTDIGSVVSARRGGQRIKKKLEDDEDDLLTVNEPMKRSGSKRKKSKSKPYPSSKRRGSFRRFDKDEDDNEGKQ